MDRKPDEMGSLGVVGICKEAYKILHLHLRLFVSLAVTLVLPLGVLIFCHGFFADLVDNKIWRDEQEAWDEVDGSPAQAQAWSRSAAEGFWLSILKLTYYVFVLVFSLLPTAAIVYTVASIYSAKGLSYVKVLSAVAKVWKRLFMTFFWAHVLIFISNVVLFVIFMFFFWFVVGMVNMNSRWASFAGILLWLLLIVFFFLAVYVFLVWHLASVVSVLEDSYGFVALRKSSDLITGKRWVACSLFLIYIIFTALVLSTYNVLVYHSNHMHNVFGRFIIGVLLLLLWTAITLIGIVVETVVYFVCKSYHEESMPLKEAVPLVVYEETPQVSQP